MSGVDKGELEKDLKAVTDLTILSESEGGKQLVDSLTKDVVSSIDDLVASRETLSLQGFIAIACDIKTRLDVIRSITRSKNNKDFLEKLLKETLQQ